MQKTHSYICQKHSVLVVFIVPFPFKGTRAVSIDTKGTVCVMMY